ncbi:MAG TPA: alpha/beta hydrolase [Thermoleophilaceae bacterium]|nr:alpha/beta hydrolase [Thermoleophilaceae bacterium]
MRRFIWLGAIALALFVHTVITDRETRDAEKRPGGQIVELTGGDLHVKDEGDRDDPAVVLLHGYTASERWWDRVTPDLVRRGLRVIRFDLLGHGRSEMPRDGYAIEEQARRVADALEKLRVRRAVVVGHSMGGNVASAMTELEPRVVRKLVIVGTPPREGYADLPLTAQISGWPVVGELARRFAPDQVIAAGLDSAFADDVDVPDAFVDDLDRMTFSAYDKAGSASDDFQEERPASERVRDAGVPLLVIFGSEDEIVEPRAAQAWRKDVPAARVEMLRGAGHSPHWERPRQVVQMLLDYTR